MRSTSIIVAAAVAGTFASAGFAQLFATGSAVGGQNRYFSINVTTGLATPLSDPNTVPTIPTTTVGLAFTPAGAASGVTNGGQLCVPNFAANTFTNVGPFGENPPGIPINAGNFDILADGRAFIYQTNEFSPLFQVDLATGAATPVNGVLDLTFALQAAGGAVGGGNQPIVIGMGSIGNTLYAIESRTNSLVATDADTGVVTVPGGVAGQLSQGTLANGNARSRYATFAGVSGYDSDNDGDYDRLFATVNTLDGLRLGALVEINPATGSWELIGPGNAPLNFFALGSPITTGPVCDSVDFNNDGLFPDTLDIDDFLSVFSGGGCSNDPNCNDVDFNNDGLFPDTLDIDALLSVFSGGPCLG
jgi:hypothetical protein